MPMTRTKLVSVTSQTAMPEEAELLREKVKTIIDERRERTLELIEKTIVFYTEVGEMQIPFENLPGVHKADAAFVADWLRDQGLVVKKPRFSNRPVIHLIRADDR